MKDTWYCFQLKLTENNDERNRSYFAFEVEHVSQGIL
jgi:hypothetical protein